MNNAEAAGDAPPIPDNLSYVAKGSYGCVIKPGLPNRPNNSNVWQQYPNSVTKLFFDKNDMIKAYNDSKFVYRLLGRNNGHKMYTYKHKYRSSNIPNNVRTRCKRIGRGRNVRLYPLRMKNLGNDFWALNRDDRYKKYRSVYVGTILDQILKVMNQIKILVENGFIHGDVRETNLMIQPSGIITLVDFDFLYPVDDYFKVAHLGFYCNPPETLMYHRIKEFLNTDDPDELFEIREIDSEIEKYADHHEKFPFVDRNYLNRKATKKDIQSALKDSLFYLTTRLDIEDSNEALQAELRRLLHPSYDGYGFAFTMLEFISYVYPTVIIRVQKPHYDEHLKSRITNEGEPYTDLQINVIRTTLHRLVFEVLAPMADLCIQRRISIFDAIERASAIINEFEERM